MYHPTRGGVRGGRDQFSWDEVKADKHRENYLGHSIKAPVGKWQKGGRVFGSYYQHSAASSARVLRCSFRFCYQEGKKANYEYVKSVVEY